MSVKGGLGLRVHLQPRASRNAVEGVHGDAVKVRLTAPPVEGAANDALLRFLAETLDCPRSALRLANGATSRRKTVEITGLPAAEVIRRLGLGGGNGRD